MEDEEENPLEIFDGYQRHTYSDTYKDEIFLVWYRHGKPTAQVLETLIGVDPETGYRANRNTLKTWASTIFKERAKPYDDEVEKQIRERAVAEKVEMLQRHSDIGKKMQEYGFDYIREHKDDLRMSTALKLLIEGINIEKESAGISGALQKMLQVSDDKLLEEVVEIFKNADVDIEAMEDDNEP